MHTWLGLLLIGIVGAAQAAPGATVTPAAGENPITAQHADVLQKALSFGLCQAPQNADQFPSQPVPVQEDQCSYYQKFEATSPGPSTGGSCGGFTVVFGPLGDLKTNWKRHMLRAEWAGEPLSQANCSKARLAVAAWGERCDNEACTSFSWQRIGSATSIPGTWRPNFGDCALQAQFIDVTHRYRTLNLDIITTLPVDGQVQRQRAKGWIRVEKGNGKCFSTTQGPRPQSTAQPASQVGGTYQGRTP